MSKTRRSQRKDTKLAKAMHVFAKGKGGDLPPATSAFDLAERKKYLLPVTPGSPRVRGGRRSTRRMRRLRR